MSQNKTRQWYNADSFSKASVLWGVVEVLKEQSRSRHARWRKYAMLYGDADIGSLGVRTYNTALPDDRLTLNVCRSVTDAYVAKITKSSVKSSFLTTNGDWSMMMRAKRLEQFMDGQFYKAGVDELDIDASRFTAVFGTSVAKVCERHGKIVMEHVFPWDVLVDDTEAIYGKPRHMYQTHCIDRQRLKSLFPKMSAKIDEAPQVVDGHMFLAPSDSSSDMVEVVEGWRLATGGKTDADMGQHVIGLPNTILFEEEWTRETFPFVFRHYTKKLVGFWGTGIVEQLVGIQIEINTLLRRAQQSMYLLGAPVVYLEAGSKVIKSHLTNEVGRIVNYTGTPPVVVSPQTVNPEIFMQIERLYTRAYEITGVSQLEASSRKPADLESGAALREFIDIGGERFIPQGRMRERWYRHLTERVIETASEMKNPPTVLGRRRRHGSWDMREIRWSDVNMERDQYILQIFPTSALPTQPSGRTATIEAWLRAGLVSQDEAKYLLDFPDLEGFVSPALAHRNVVLAAYERMVEDGEYVSPESYQDLTGALQLMQGSYLNARMNGVSEDRLALLRDYMAACVEMLKQTMPQEPHVAQPPNGPSMIPQGAQAAA